MSKVEQVGGAHYQTGKAEQHWDRIWKLYGRGYFVGCATKYVERYHAKNGKEDLLKAISFIEKLIELEYPEEVPPPGAMVPSSYIVSQHFVTTLHRGDGLQQYECRLCKDSPFGKFMGKDPDALMHLKVSHGIG